MENIKLVNKLKNDLIKIDSDIKKLNYNKNDYELINSVVEILFIKINKLNNFELNWGYDLEKIEIEIKNLERINNYNFLRFIKIEGEFEKFNYN